ncbi:hypothetical protein V6Z12_D08G246500 [Gossypium hirsutum]
MTGDANADLAAGERASFKDQFHHLIEQSMVKVVIIKLLRRRIGFSSFMAKIPSSWKLQLNGN